jgi:pilus assembly protein CpaE
METVKILIVNDNIPAADNLTKFLQFEKDFEITDTVHTGEEAISRCEDSSPHVVLMDRGLPGMDGFQATEAIKKLDPSVQVILTSVETGTNHARRAILCGATDFLTWEATSEDMVSAIRLASSKRPPPVPPEKEKEPIRPPRQPGKIIGVYSGKGGVGCTTLAINLALALHTDNTPCVLVDADLQYGDVAVALNMQPHYSLADLTGHGDGLDEELVTEVLLQHSSGLRVLAAPPRPELAEEVRAEGFGQVLQLLKQLFAYVVVDTASYLDDIAIIVLESADQILNVMEPDIPSIKNARSTLETLAELGIPSEHVLLVLNQVKRGDPIRAENIAQNLNHEVLVEINYDREAVKNAINRGEPLLTDKKTHPLTRSMLDLVGMVREQLLAVEE